MNDFNGTLEKFHAERGRLEATYGIKNTHAGCYLCNYGEAYMCGKCKWAELCQVIHDGEKKNVGTLK